MATMVLVLAFWAFPAAAGSRHLHERSDRHTQVRQPVGQERVAELARELAQATHRVHSRAERTAHHPGWREAQALRSLHHLDDVARRFHRRAERPGGASQPDVQRLARAYRGAEARFHQLHARRRVEADFERVGRMLQRLQRLHAGYAPPDRDRYAHHRQPRRPVFRVDLAWRY